MGPSEHHAKHHHDHSGHHAHREPHFWVMAQVIEPDYEKELKFLQAEMMFVQQKLREENGLSLPALGFYGHKDWKKYVHKLEAYEKQLEHYSNDTDDGILPVKFTVFNTSELRDTGVHVTVKVKSGRLDEKRKAPERPERVDGHGKGLPKLALPKAGFRRSGIKIAPHSLGAVFSRLDSRDGAALVNQVVHLHLGSDTEVTYEIMSRQVPHERGSVELVEKPAD